ncbi:MAG: hypothetical protein KTR20_09140 [Cellvibrionaceae bacterium]|nr:hypothetical protein [Cellvibrionaceae bacterium]
MIHNDMVHDAASNAPLFALMGNDTLSDLLTKEAEREELKRQMDAFFSDGGKINYVAPNVLADPPKKPTSNYGSQPI